MNYLYEDKEVLVLSVVAHKIGVVDISKVEEERKYEWIVCKRICLRELIQI